MPKNVITWNKLIAQQAKCGHGREALRLYDNMREEGGVIPDHCTFVAALKACTTMADLEGGKRIHIHAKRSGLGFSLVVASTLLDMYAKCGSIDDARRVFEHMKHRDVVTWNAMITGYAHMEMGASALELYARMHNEGLQPNARTFVAALKACTTLPPQGEGSSVDAELLNSSCLEQGRAIHAEASNRGFESDIFLANTLIYMYSKCGSIEDARHVFNNMTHRSIVSWNAMIIGYAQIDMGTSALELYGHMQNEGLRPNARTFVAALTACASLARQEEGKVSNYEVVKTSYLEQGRAIHVEISRRGFESDIFVANTLVDMYAKCGSIDDACRVFDRMRHRNVVSWNAMIIGCAQMEMGDLALEMYVHMQLEGFVPDHRTFAAILKSCTSLAALEGDKDADTKLNKTSCLQLGRTIHADLVKRGFESDIFIANALVDMYAKCGSVEDAHQVFHKMTHRDVVSWNSIITGYAQMEMGDLALKLYVGMQNEGFAPNARTFLAVLKAYASLAAQGVKGPDRKLLKTFYLEQGRALHAEVEKRGFGSDIFIASTLVDMYVKCGSIEDAREVFERMKYPNVVFWNTLIIGYAQMEMGDLALELYACMKDEGLAPDAHTFTAALKACTSLPAEDGKGAEALIPKLEQGRAIHAEVAKGGLESNIFVASTLVDMYAKLGSIEDACQVFKKMEHRDLVSWNAMITGYAQMEMWDLTLELYACVQHEGFTPDARTFVAALQACASLSSLETGKEIHSRIHGVGLQDELSMAICLIDMYGKCGSMWDAEQVFDSLPVRTTVTWNALIAGYSGRGDFEYVFDLYSRMQQEGIKPDAVTLVSLLNVCNHNGLVDRGQLYFQAMCLDYGIVPIRNHYTCMTDLLGRAGRLDEAAATVTKMPFEPDTVTWMSILGACRKWNNVETGRTVFECAAMLNEKFAAAHVLMRNIYLCSGMLEDSVK